MKAVEICADCQVTEAVWDSLCEVCLERNRMESKDLVTLPREDVASLIDRIRGLEISLMYVQSTDLDEDSARVESKYHERMRDLLGVPIPEPEPEPEPEPSSHQRFPCFCPKCDGLRTLDSSG